MIFRINESEQHKIIGLARGNDYTVVNLQNFRLEEVAVLVVEATVQLAEHPSQAVRLELNDMVWPVIGRDDVVVWRGARFSSGAPIYRVAIPRTHRLSWS